MHSRADLVAQASRLQVMRRTAPLMPLALPAALLLVWLLSQQQAGGGLWLWLPLHAVLLAAWVAVAWQARRLDDAAMVACQRLWQVYFVLAACCSLSWSLPLLWQWPQPRGEVVVLCLLWLTAVGAMQSALFSGQRPVFYVCLVLMWLPVISMQLLHHDPLLRWLGVSCLIYAVVLIRFSAQLHDFVQEACHSQAECQVLEQQLAAKQQELDQCNVLLEHENAALDAALQHLAHVASRDPLTGVLNLRALTATLEDHASQAGARGLALLDLDHFKAINDRHGHPVGDDVLCLFCQLVQQRLRDGDCFGRYGGEEFLLLMPLADESTFLQRLEQIRQTIAEHDWRALTGDTPVTVSIGGVCSRGGTDAYALIGMADRALYQAKREGRNRTVMVSGLPQSAAQLARGAS